MPPAKRTHEDPQSLKEKLHAGQGNGNRGRRNNGTSNVTNGSNLKEVVSSAAIDTAAANNSHSEQNNSGISWKDQDIALLHSFRRTYRLDTPSAFKKPLSQVVLGSGIGRYSPTMARPKAKRRVPKEQLAMAVRKNFNALGVSETDVIVDMLYKVKNQDKEFRVRFTPRK
ncbi:hypothetical protein BU24DRAFT_115820 [Aaosphaeria arxii CBS 175.79]|uniref:Histone deacetylase complex subunit SAP30 Sin3 binding domain-containing protein n=1 Tax=Aaosphaeria arxii CBS 175.79 TaxID=1450172 RepID=A0A6A5Y230_9PLEO|nr:uncharacterized protein BU24DRAFT_115820 [Aaosphaeria arxii CBS 175.79]KAF2019273.1 hypothetical protein BU24DRAFT_115820 [Aaosphaeria arxii CBS 175.79]